MPSKRNKNGKGPRSASCIGRRHKNKLWMRRKLTHTDHESDHKARSDDNTDNEESLEVPSELEDVVNKIVSEMDQSPMETPTVHLQGVSVQVLCDCHTNTYIIDVCLGISQFFC